MAMPARAGGCAPPAEIPLGCEAGVLANGVRACPYGVLAPESGARCAASPYLCRASGRDPSPHRSSRRRAKRTCPCRVVAFPCPTRPRTHRPSPTETFPRRPAWVATELASAFYSFPAVQGETRHTHSLRYPPYTLPRYTRRLEGLGWSLAAAGPPTVMLGWRRAGGKQQRHPSPRNHSPFSWPPPAAARTPHQRGRRATCSRGAPRLPPHEHLLTPRLHCHFSARATASVSAWVNLVYGRRGPVHALRPVPFAQSLRALSSLARTRSLLWCGDLMPRQGRPTPMLSGTW